MKEFANLTQLSNELKNRESYSQCIIIGIDGFLGVGKTYFTEELKKILNITAVNIDKYRNKNIEGSVMNIRLKKMKKDIALMSKKRSLIIEGICLLNILQKIGVKCDLLIYIKRIKQVSSSYSCWQDEDTCEYNGNLEDKIKRYELNAKKFSEDPNYKPELTAIKECIKYHQEYKPHINADYCYKRTIKE